jgi:two-component system response regulator HydG
VSGTEGLEAYPVRVLVAEDDREMLELVEQVLRDEGYAVLTARDGREALAAIEAGKFDVVVSDVKMPGASGIDVLRTARARTLHQPVVLMTAFGSIDAAVEAMKEGAYSYITKPFDLDDLLAILREVAVQVRMRKQAEDLATAEGEDTPFPIIFRGRAFREVIKLVRDVAKSTASVLITGESGTGKELIAREIHRRSLRAGGAFVALDVNAIPETLLESELFGHVRGSFTGAVRDKAGMFEQADGGTLFLDEIGNFNLAVQAKLLRFLQERTLRRVGDTREKTVDVRLVTATHRNLKKLMAEGTFREDLFYRLSVIHIEVPTLRERREDIAPLAYHFLRKYNKELRVDGFRPEVLDLLVDFDWPGNVRQLENAIEHAVILRKTGLIQKSDLPEWVSSQGKVGASDQRSLEAVEKAHILRLLEECEGNQSRAARILGINRRTLARKLKSYGIAWAEEEGDE